ncbi:Ceramide glucosyltransferase [Sorochytrium milnesiophthora]
MIAPSWLTLDHALVGLSFVWWFFIAFVSWAGALVSFARYRRFQAAQLRVHAAKRQGVKPSDDDQATLLPDIRYYDPAVGVTILRPLKGVDCSLLTNLESSFLQSHRNVEIIFSVADDDDPAIDVVHQLLAKYPDVDAKLLIGERIVGNNPKINNLINSYEQARHDIIWICDSNVSVEPDCLKRSVSKLCKPGVGLVHHLPVAVDPQSFGSALEQVYFNGNHAKMYLGINFIGPSSCVIGKSNLFRRSDLERCGGLEFFGRYLAEDNTVGQALWDEGLKHEMTCDIARQSVGAMTVKDYFLRKMRWGRIRKYYVPLGAAIEPFAESIMCGIIGSYGFSRLLGISQLWLALAHVALTFAVDCTVVRNLVFPQQPLPLSRFAMMWAIRELSALPVFLWAVSGNTVSWRNTTYQLLWGGDVRKITNGVATPMCTTPLRPRANIRTSATSHAALAARSLRFAADAATGATAASDDTKDSKLQAYKKPFVMIVTYLTLASHLSLNLLLGQRYTGTSDLPPPPPSLSVAGRYRSRSGSENMSSTMPLSLASLASSNDSLGAPATRRATPAYTYGSVRLPSGSQYIPKSSVSSSSPSVSSATSTGASSLPSLGPLASCRIRSRTSSTSTELREPMARFIS